MGVTLSCKKTRLSIDMGYGGFERLRSKVAEIYNNDFWLHYKLLLEPRVMFLTGDKRKEYFNKFDQKTDEMIKRKKLSSGLVSFCFQPDIGGNVSYRACKVIYKTVKGYDDNICYGYSGRPDCAMFADFKKILEDCIKTKSCLVWD